MELETSTGQAEADPSGTTVEAPGASEEQSVASTQTTVSGPGSEDVETFFDPKDLVTPAEKAAYKQMQGEFTKRNQHFSGEQQKLDQYNQFMTDPVGNMRQLAQQYGYNLLERGAQQASGDEEFNPQTWDDVMAEAKKQVTADLRKEFAPLNNEVKNLKKQNVEQKLDRDYPDWRTYEQQMSETLQRHPTLVNDTDALYQMAVPKAVLEQRATKAALSKIKGTTDSSQLGDNKTTSIPTTEKPAKFATVAEAAKWAKAHLASQGITGTVD